MGDSTCAEDDCEDPGWARGLCRRHYNSAYRRNQLPGLKAYPDAEIHSLSNVDPANLLADCTICGPGIPIRASSRKGKKTPDLRCSLKKRSHHSSTETPAQRAAYRRKYRLKRKYGLSPSDLEDMLVRQGGACCICKSRGVELFVDHDHASGAVRGLLCRGCNTALGWLRDDPQLAEQAAHYLRASAA